MKINFKINHPIFYTSAFILLSLLTSCTKDAVVETSTQPKLAPIQPKLAQQQLEPIAGYHLGQYGTPFAEVPAPADAIIYQVNIRCFSSTHDFQGVINRLDNIKALGANVIYLMPIYPIGIDKSINSPYCLSSYNLVNPEFGDLDKLRTLVDGAHLRGMAVILDWVGNHTSWDHTWAKQNTSWYVLNASGGFTSPNGWNDVIQLNFANKDMRAEMIHTMMDWVYTANVDGFRCDYSDGPPADFWKQAIDSLRTINTHKILMFAEGSRSANYTSGFNYNFGFAFYDQLKKTYANNASVRLLDNFTTTDYIGASADQYMIRYTTNHDVNGSDGTPLDLFGGKAGSMAAFIVTSYLKSVPMIYNGQEVATSYRLTFPFKTTTINWTVNPDVTAEYTKVIAFRKSSNAIKRGALISYSSNDVCAFSKTIDSEKVFVLSNMRNQSVTYTLPTAIAGSTWNDVFATPIAPVSFGTTITLSPYEYRVFQVQEIVTSL